MILADLGYNADFNNHRMEQGLDSFGVGRVISEHKERYIVKTTENEFEAEIVGNLRFSANKRSDFPAVGDWVAISEYDENRVLIHSIFPRKTIIERQAVGKQGEKQIIATNIDFAFIIHNVPPPTCFSTNFYAFQFRPASRSMIAFKNIQHGITDKIKMPGIYAGILFFGKSPEGIFFISYSFEEMGAVVEPAICYNHRKVGKL